MTTSVTRRTSRNYTRPARSRPIFWSQTGLVLRPTVSYHITGSDHPVGNDGCFYSTQPRKQACSVGDRWRRRLRWRQGRRHCGRVHLSFAGVCSSDWCRSGEFFLAGDRKSVCVEWDVKLYYTIPQRSPDPLAGGEGLPTESHPRSRLSALRSWLPVKFTGQGKARLLASVELTLWQPRKEAQLMLTNPRDLFRGQSGSPNSSIPYDRYTFLMCNRNFVFKTIFDFKKCRDLEIGV